MKTGQSQEKEKKKEKVTTLLPKLSESKPCQSERWGDGVEGKREGDWEGMSICVWETSVACIHEMLAL